jgi:hypothetical protein
LHILATGKLQKVPDTTPDTEFASDRLLRTSELVTGSPESQSTARIRRRTHGVIQTLGVSAGGRSGEAVLGGQRSNPPAGRELPLIARRAKASLGMPRRPDLMSELRR